MYVHPEKTFSRAFTTNSNADVLEFINEVIDVIVITSVEQNVVNIQDSNDLGSDKEARVELRRLQALLLHLLRDVLVEVAR
jgi:hypothetical protein